MSYEQIGMAFQSHFYTTFDTNRVNLAPLYGADSLLTFEEEQFQGQAKIMEKLMALPFSVVQHKVTKVDCQPTDNGAILVMVVGLLQADQDKPLGFSQTFLLKPASGSYYIGNDIFRLALHDIAA
eukprot:m.212200 g.212200  ORF g.212200 m.212200 type:complete len:125 (-) comp19811_c0_seq1:265-639(-)